MPARRYLDLVKKAIVAWNEDYAQSMGAALAYYTTFSLAPVLIVVIAVAGLVFSADAARGEIVNQLRGLIGDESARAVQALLISASQPGKSVLASSIGILTLLIGATSVFAELQSSLDRIWRAPALAKSSGIWALLRSRLLTFGMVVAIGFLLLVSLVFSAAVSGVDRWGGMLFPRWHAVLQVVNIGVGFALTAVLFAMAYRILPRVNIAWRDVGIGAVVTAALFEGGKYLIGLYLGHASVSSGFGAAGSLVVLLVWVYYSAQIFLLGAEFTWVYAHSHGSRAGQKPAPAPPIPISPAA
ncbi:MAG TPA: YihY/virulence factor BrkB family protein [Vicinamibacterales bacterium]|nr:YihY/virulence factor BrkB family protein [Vicinamibacterales bacterium]